MNDVIEVWSRSGENLEAIACSLGDTALRGTGSRLIQTRVLQK